MDYKKIINYIDFFIVSWLLLFVFVQFRLHLFEYQTMKVITGLMIMSIIAKLILRQYVFSKHWLPITIVAAITVLLLVINISKSSTECLKENIVYIGACISLYIYLGTLVKKDNISSYLSKLIIPLNIYLFISALVVAIQVQGNYFLVDTSTPNTYYPDLCSGLFGGSDGTHRLTLFFAFMVVFDLMHIKLLHGKKKKCIVLCLILSLLLNTYASTKNDNVGFFAFVPLTALMYYLLSVDSMKSLLKTIYKPLLVIIVGMFVVGIIMFNSNNPELELISGRIRATILSYSISKDGVQSNDERFKYFSLALANGGFLGEGFGSIHLLGDGRIHPHFGMASIQSYVYILGIGTTLLILLLISMFYSRTSKRFIIISFLFTFFLFSVTYYTQVLTVFNVGILHAFTMLLLANSTKNA